MLKKALAGVLGATLLSGTAFAATTITATPLQVDAAGAVVVDFNGALPAGYTLSGSYSYATGTTPNLQAAPAGDATQYLVVPQDGSVSGFADLLGTTGYDTVSFYWGSIDTYNSVQFLDAAGNVFGDVYAGSYPGIADPTADGGQAGPGTNRRITFTQGAGDPLIYGLRFTNNGQRAFELDNVAFGAVPEPATWAMLIAGFGLVGGAMRRRRSSTTMVTA